MVIISYYLKVCLSPGFPLARSPGSGLAARPVYSLASCYCFCRSVSMNSPFRVRLEGHRPRLPPCPVSGLPAVPVAPSFRLGVQKYIFFSNRQTFSEKFFEKFFSRGSRPLCLPRSPAPLPRNRTAKVLLFYNPPNFFQEIFRENSQSADCQHQKNARILINSPPERGSGLKNAPPPHRNYSRFRASISNCSLHFPSSQT